MALSTPATAPLRAHQSPELQVYCDVIEFPGDDDYVTGGTPEFQSFVRAAVGHNVTVIAIIDVGSNTAGTPALFEPVYDQANDTLIVLDPARVEVAATTDLSTTTFRLAVLSK
jgi:hypothetical protein